MSGARRMEWTPERIGAFWDYWSARAGAHEDYFAHQVGGGIVELLDQAAQVRGRRVLDLGCGPGFLIPHLIRKGAQVWAADGSLSAVSQANARFGETPGWGGAKRMEGARTGYDDGAFGAVCCVEVIEHLPADAAPTLLEEIARVLAPGGRALITTPDDEDLERSMIYCPACREEFHKVQHLTSWTDEALEALLATAGLRVEFCAGIDLARFVPRGGKPLHHVDLADLWKAGRRTWARILDGIAPRPFPAGRSFRLLATPGPHLVAVAVKPGGGAA